MARLGSNQLGTHQLGKEGFVPPDIQVWRLIRDGDQLEDDLYDVQITDTANPFGNFAIAYLDDTDGTKFDQYTRGTRVDFEVSTDAGVNFTRRFSGYVVEAREQNQQGADSLEIEAYSFDQFLRRSSVSENQSGRTISEALENIIKNDTPVTWDASNVTVIDNTELTRSYRGERVENVLRSLASASANEGFGVNKDVEFFFRPDEVENAPRGIDNSQWFDYDIPEQGKETVNEVTVFFDNGNQSVTVDNGSDKTDLQESLSTQDPVVIGQEVSRPDITEIRDAQAVGQQILNDRKPTLTGTVTTFGLINAQPGDVISITINERGIDDDFRIAQIEYLWGRGETRLTIVRKKGNQDELLVRLSDSVQRIETQDVDRDGAGNFITSTNIDVLLSVSGDVDGTAFEAAKVTNRLRNQLRDGWAGQSNVDVAEIAVGNGTATPTRSDTSLVNELERESVTESLPDGQSVQYEADFSTTDIREVGLFNSSGNLLARATISEDTLSGTVSVSLRIDAENDSSTGTGVVTNTGLTAVRDIIADNNPNPPTDYAYGSDSSNPSVSDTALGNQLITADLTEVKLQSAASADEWSDIISVGNQEPVIVNQNTNRLEAVPVTFLTEAEDATNIAPLVTNVGDLSGDAGRELTAGGEFVEIEITPEYDVPTDELDVRTMVNLDNFDGTVNAHFYPEGDTASIANKIRSVRYLNETEQNITTLGRNGVNDNVIQAGETFIYRVEADTINSGQIVIDMLYAYDARFNINFSPTFDSSTASFNGPEIYPELVEVQFPTETTQREIDAASVKQAWNNTENNQFIELSNDNKTTFIRSDNTQTANVTFPNESRNLTCRIGISRFTANSTVTPTKGDSGQTIDTHSLNANVETITPSDVGTVNVRAIIPLGDLAGDFIREAAQLDVNGNLITRATFAEHEVETDERVISSESVKWLND